MNTYILSVLLFPVNEPTSELDYSVTASSFATAQAMVHTNIAKNYNDLADYFIIDDTEEECLEYAKLTKGDIQLKELCKVKQSNINKQAMALAWLLLKANNIMTSKAKSFGYFLGIAYKMLKNDAHFVYVLRGLSDVHTAMRKDSKINPTRFDIFSDTYMAIRWMATPQQRNTVKW